jgi:hypothetical protein
VLRLLRTKISPAVAHQSAPQIPHALSHAAAFRKAMLLACFELQLLGARSLGNAQKGNQLQRRDVAPANGWICVDKECYLGHSPGNGTPIALADMDGRLRALHDDAKCFERLGG